VEEDNEKMRKLLNNLKNVVENKKKFGKDKKQILRQMKAVIDKVCSPSHSEKKNSSKHIDLSSNSKDSQNKLLLFANPDANLKQFRTNSFQ
jgi:hypothetical protein